MIGALLKGILKAHANNLPVHIFSSLIEKGRKLPVST
jgi:hypothetical protein